MRVKTQRTITATLATSTTAAMGWNVIRSWKATMPMSAEPPGSAMTTIGMDASRGPACRALWASRKPTLAMISQAYGSHEVTAS